MIIDIEKGTVESRCKKQHNEGSTQAESRFVHNKNSSKCEVSKTM
jgi:hypothetical protein